MLRIHPFRAVRPQPNLAARVASVPYDVVDTPEARRLAAGNPLSFLHVVRPEIDLPDGTDLYDDAVYVAAARSFRRLLDDGALLRERSPSLYLYRLVMRHRSQIGVVCCCHVDDYTSGVVRRHEETRRSKEDDRTRHTTAINANGGPVLLCHRDDPAITALVERARNRRPLYHFDAADDVTHTAWTIDDPAPFVEAFARVPRAYVADGHHRSASAARVAAERRAANAAHTGEEEYNWFLAVLFPASQLTILPYHRVLLDTGDRDATAVLDALRAVGRLTATDDPNPGRGAFCFYLDGGWHRLEIDPATIDHDDPVASLDVALLHDRVLQPVFGITDARSDPRVDFVGGGGGPAALAERVDAGDAAVGIAVPATTIDQLLTVADAGRSMPPKSTWFEPKLRSGLFVHELG